MKLAVIDSNSILNRAFYGIRILTNSKGQYTNGIFGFFNILQRLLEDLAPDRLAFAFDLSGPTFRHLQYEGYKATRKGMPQELASQLGPLKELIRLLGYQVVEAPGYEADDILGTLSRLAREAGEECVLITGDRDSYQLIGDGVQVCLAATRMGKAEYTLLDEAAIREQYGVAPRQMIEVKALMGDTSDNIPGVAGIGEKTALALIRQFGSLQGVYDHLEDAAIKPGVRAKLAAGRESAALSRSLAEICLEAPIDNDLDAYLPRPMDRAGAAALLGELELYTLMDRLGLKLEEGIPLAESPAAAFTARFGGSLTGEQLAAWGPGDRVDLFCHWEEGRPAQVSLFWEGAEYRVGEEGLLRRLAGLPVKKRMLATKPFYRWCLEEGIPWQQVEFDGSLAAYLLSPSASDYDFERLCGQYKIPEAADGPEPLPAARLSLLCDRLEEEILAHDQEELLHRIEQPLAQVLAEMEEAGFLVDTGAIRAFGGELDRDLEQLEARIYEEAGERFNINSPKQLGVILFEKLHLPAKKKTKSGYSTSAEVLEGLAGRHPIVQDILDYRTKAKLKSTYVEGLLKVADQSGRVHSSFQQTETRTGRISSTEPNLQNIPVRSELGSNLRRFFIAPEGMVLVDADYSQIELRVLAHLSGDENMISAFLSGEDIHTKTAAQVFHMPQEFVTPLMRSRAKAVNFGIVYGIGAFSLSKNIGVTVAEASDYIEKYLDTYPGVRRYMAETVENAKKLGYVRTMFGRCRYLPELGATNRITRAFGERVAMNTPIQGSAADIIKIAMVRVARRLEREGLRARLILQVHDELIVESPKAEEEAVRRLLKEEMEAACALKAPLVADVGAGESWYDAK